MIYPGTQDAMSVGQGNSGGDAKKRLIDMMSKKGALPLFGGQGRNANDLPSVGAPAINFNPFLKMLAGRSGETFNSLPQDVSGQMAAGIQNGPGPVQGGGAMGDPNNAGFQGSNVPTQGASGAGLPGIQAASGPTNPSQADPNAFSGGYGHYNEGSGVQATGQTPATSPTMGTDSWGAAGYGTTGHTTGLGGLSQLDPQTAMFLLHLSGGLQGYNQDR